MEGKHTETQYFTWFGKTPTSTRESYFIRDRERITTNTWRRINTQLPSLTAAMAAALSLHFIVTHVFSLLTFSSICMCPFIGIWWLLFFFPAAAHGSQWWLPSSSTNAAATCSTCRWWGIANKWQYLTITPFAIYLGNCHLDSLALACILQLFQAYHSESICG